MRLLGAALLLVLVAGCSTSTGLPSAAPQDTSGGVGTLGPPDTGNTGDTSQPSQITIDPALLAVLPRTADGVQIIESPEGDSDALADDVLPMIASAAVGFEAADPTTTDIASGFVVKLLPGKFSDNEFSSWRSSYEAGVCGDETQVSGEASASVGGNTVYIGTCQNGLRTYQLWLKDKGILIALSSYGDRHLGLVIVGNLRK
ncbi:MAG TPA: hypothetical protein VKR30_05605 [Candidatus Limnocylindrales bacterium]|nr:hypothetical protein [Candidatus Limnocylindrales bacterium]